MIIRTIFSIFLAASVLSTPVHGEVEIAAEQILALEEAPLDALISGDRKRIFVLTEKGHLLIYNANGALEDKLDLGGAFDALRAGPGENSLVLTNRKQNLIKVIALDFIKHINTAGSPFKGPKDAPVEIVVFSDFQCPYCSQIPALLDQVFGEFEGKVKIVFKNFPLRSHNFSLQSAIAALAAAEQGKFWEFHDLLFKNYNQLNEQKVQEIVSVLGLNREKFEQDRKNPAITGKIREDVKDATEAGVTGTPVVLINGRTLRNRSLEGIRSAVEKELDKCAGDEGEDEP